MRQLLLGCLVILIGQLTGCNRHPGPPPTPPPPVVSVTQPIVYPVQEYFEYNGNLDAVETVQIVARVKGFLNAVLFTEGQDVEKGKLLFKIDPREYEAAVKVAEADRRKALTQLKLARVEVQRVQSLRGPAAISAEEVAQRVATMESAEAVLKQTEASLEARQLERSFTEITSPIVGQIGRALITPGNLVGQNGDTLLTTVVRMDPLYIYFDAPERDLVEYQRSARAAEAGNLLAQSIPVEIGVATEKGFPHVGKIDFRENRVDAGTGTVRGRGQIPNPRVPPANARLLYPGLYARVRVPNGPSHPLPIIPEDALMTGQEGRFVYVLGPDNIVEKRTVTVGPHVWKAGTLAEVGEPGWTVTHNAPEAEKKPVTQPVLSAVAITAGLSADDRIIFNGLVKARPGTPVAPQVWLLKAPAPSAKAD